ncbi:MAG: hypothetical protein Q4F27_04825, partial [Desulfovibrionaceae bacterium]|nr:hypothetical protein [Desulfovibrionaceae bacterium]
MNISTEQLDSLLRLQEQQAGALHRQAGQGESFEALLARQMGEGAEVSASAGGLMPGSSQVGLISQMLLQNTEYSQALDPDAAVLQAAFEQASGTLELWDGYSRALGSSGTGTAAGE